MQRRINVRGIIINDQGEIFCQRLTAKNSDGRNFWCTPGGGLEIQLPFLKVSLKISIL